LSEAPSLLPQPRQLLPLAGGRDVRGERGAHHLPPFGPRGSTVSGRQR